MKVRFSPIIAQASGSAGPVVASRWKGIPFIRSRVTPTNPKSDDQKAVRAILTRCVGLWHDLETQVQDCIEGLAGGQPASGFNIFTRQLAKDMYTWLTTIKQPTPTDQELRLLPLNATENPVGVVTLTAETASGELTIAWTLGDAAPSHNVYVLASEVSGDHVMPTNLLRRDEEGTGLVEPQSLLLTGLTPDAWHFVAVLAEDPDAHNFSIARSGWCKSHA
jgi:hypothetical protein